MNRAVGIVFAAAVSIAGCKGDGDDVVTARPNADNDEPSATITVGASATRIDGKEVDNTRLQGILAALSKERGDQPVAVVVEPKTPFKAVSAVVD